MIFVAAGGGEAAGVNDAPYKSAFAATAPGDTAATRGCSGEEVEHSSVAGVTAPPTGPEQTSPPMPADGRLTFRFATFDDERFWGDELQLHRAIAGAKLGGSGRGLTPTAALALGLKVDVDALPAELIEKLSKSVDLDNPAVTADLLKLDAVVGMKGFLTKDGKLSSVGITCAACHSTVDDSLAPGVGHRRDGRPNRDLDLGTIISLAPNLKPTADRLGITEDELKQALASWGPGKYDADLVPMSMRFAEGTPPPPCCRSRLNNSARAVTAKADVSSVSGGNHEFANN